MADMRPQGQVLPRDGDGPGHEQTEGVSLRGIFGFAAALVVLWVGAELGLIPLMNRFSARESKNLSRRPPMMSSPVEIPGPRLQGTPARDRVREQELQLKHLNGYGWSDKQAGIVHIPIDRAMDILAERGLPEIKDPETPAEKEQKPEAPAEKEQKPGAPAEKEQKP